jgi:hypothetical protein
MIASALTSQTPPVSSWGTFHVAYTLVAAICIGYTLSLWARGRRYRRTIESGPPQPSPRG